MSRRLLAAVSEAAAGLLLLALVSYLAARLGLGSPLAGLGAEGEIGGKAAERLRRLYGLDESFLRGFLSWLQGLARGEAGPSMVYGVDALRIVAAGLAATLAPVTLGGLAALAAAWSALASFWPRLPAATRLLAHVPGYVYAYTAAVAAWLLGLGGAPSASPIRVLVYAAVVAAALAPRLLHAGSEALRDALEDNAAVLAAARAMGHPPSWRRRLLLRAAAPALLSYWLMLYAYVFERSIVLEPLLSYPGLGSLLAKALLEADPVLAATGLLAVGLVSYAASLAASLLGR